MKSAGLSPTVWFKPLKVYLDFEILKVSATQRPFDVWLG